MKKTMLKCQKDKFSLPEHSAYLNCAYFSPQLKAVEEVGHQAVSRKNIPFEITLDDFFNPVTELKRRFARLISAPDHERIAVIPGVSYGIETAAKNIPLQSGEHILVVEEQFPSNMYPWIRKAKEGGADIKTIPRFSDQDTTTWNDRIINSIDQHTRIVAIANVHWADGYRFDLKSIRDACDRYGAYLVIDGSQSVGALPFSVEEIRPDVLVCAGYKWLLGPYSLCMAYFNEKFDNGEPLEACWINKEGSEDFKNLAKYRDGYKSKAARYNMSESSNFVLVPMLSEGIRQLLDWTPDNIQSYCKHISENALSELDQLDCHMSEGDSRAHHLFGIRLGSSMSLSKIQEEFAKHQIYVSFRGNAIRISVHLYNTAEDIEKLVDCIKKGQ